MRFTIRPFRRFPVQCSVTYNAGPFLKLPLAYCSGYGSACGIGGLFLTLVKAERKP